MNVMKPFALSENLACPLDGLGLSCCEQGQQLRCANGHCFDVARQGYINLLGVQDKRSKDPGDTREMIAARRRILDSGLYEPIAAMLVQLIDAGLRNRPGSKPMSVDGKPSIAILDAGCGEGYYLEYCLEALAGHYSVQGIGLDISKWAIMAAAKRNQNITWLVGSNRNPPVLPGSIDVIICGFGFPDFSAFRRILKPDGLLLMLDPAEKHLLELRQVIYPVIKPYKGNDFSRAVAAGFAVVERKRLTYDARAVSQKQIQDILVMSPHLYKATSEGKAAALVLPGLDLTLDVHFSVLAL